MANKAPTFLLLLVVYGLLFASAHAKTGAAHASRRMLKSRSGGQQYRVAALGSVSSTAVLSGQNVTALLYTGGDPGGQLTSQGRSVCDDLAQLRTEDGIPLSLPWADMHNAIGFRVDLPGGVVPEEASTFIKVTHRDRRPPTLAWSAAGQAPLEAEAQVLAVVVRGSAGTHIYSYHAESLDVEEDEDEDYDYDYGDVGPAVTVSDSGLRPPARKDGSEDVITSYSVCLRPQAVVKVISVEGVSPQEQCVHPLSAVKIRMNYTLPIGSSLMTEEQRTIKITVHRDGEDVTWRFRTTWGNIGIFSSSSLLHVVEALASPAQQQSVVFGQYLHPYDDVGGKNDGILPGTYVVTASDPSGNTVTTSFKVETVPPPPGQSAKLTVQQFDAATQTWQAVANDTWLEEAFLFTGLSDEEIQRHDRHPISFGPAPVVSFPEGTQSRVRVCAKATGNPKSLVLTFREDVIVKGKKLPGTNQMSMNLTDESPCFELPAEYFQGVFTYNVEAVWQLDAYFDCGAEHSVVGLRVTDVCATQQSLVLSGSSEHSGAGAPTFKMTLTFFEIGKRALPQVSDWPGDADHVDAHYAAVNVTRLEDGTPLRGVELAAVNWPGRAAEGKRRRMQGLARRLLQEEDDGSWSRADWEDVQQVELFQAEAGLRTVELVVTLPEGTAPGEYQVTGLLRFEDWTVFEAIDSCFSSFGLVDGDGKPVTLKIAGLA